METNHQDTAPEASPETPKGSNWGKRLAIGGIAVIALAGVGVAGALSQDYGGERMHRFGMGQGGPGMHMQGGPGMHMQATPAAFGHGMGFGGRGMGRILDEVDATKEQEDQIEAIMDKVHDEVRPIMRSFRDTRDDVAELLGAATIDRAAAETLRAERVAAMDEASKKITAALLDAAEVLTPEQRTKLLEHFEDRGRRGRW